MGLNVRVCFAVWRHQVIQQMMYALWLSRLWEGQWIQSVHHKWHDVYQAGDWLASLRHISWHSVVRTLMFSFMWCCCAVKKQKPLTSCAAQVIVCSIDWIKCWWGKKSNSIFCPSVLTAKGQFWYQTQLETCELQCPHHNYNGNNMYNNMHPLFIAVFE